jgi:hypothetical protein
MAATSPAQPTRSVQRVVYRAFGVVRWLLEPSGVEQRRGKAVVEGPDMSAFVVELQNRPGELARLCDAMAGQGVNLVLCAIAHGDSGTIAFVVDDEATGRTVLDGAGIEYAERPALTVRMDNVPGAGAVTFLRLAKAGVNVELLLPIRISSEQFFAVICVDDVEAASEALGEQVIPAAGLS